MAAAERMGVTILRQVLKVVVGGLGHATGVGPLVLRRRRVGEGLVVLSFHKVVVEPYFRAQMAISREAFARFLDFLVDQVDIVDLVDAVQSVGVIEQRPERLKVALTFDDGYRDNFEHALPELQKRSLPATVFLATGFLDDAGLYPWWDGLAYVLTALEYATVNARNEVRRQFKKFSIVVGDFTQPLGAGAINAVVDQVRTMPESGRRDLINGLMAMAVEFKQARPRIMLNWVEARAMAAAGIRFGAHTVTHPNLDQLSKPDMVYELENCRHRIQQETDQRATAFAYPSGRYSSAVVEAVRGLGFEMACTTVPGVFRSGFDRFLVPRVDISDNVIQGINTAFSPSMWHFQLLQQAR
ncbi:MAG: polysaccharide deacetylase family protein [Rectinemataceae bacterium]|nr:polysaccharide deacetylase family protein [Rectinemataceae bacterium]